MRAEERQLPPVDELNLSREEIVRNQQVPPPLALMFSMAEGTTKRLEGPRDTGWFVVDLDDITTDEISADDPLLAATKAQLGNALSEEYEVQLTRAMREELGVERNEAAVEAVRKQLVGES